MKVTLMGTRGVPAQYGGFETAVEEIGKRLAARGYDVTVYCRNPGQRITEYEGMRLVNAPAIRHRVAETLSHSAASTAHAIVRDHPDVVLLLNAGNAPMLRPLALAGIPTAIHLDGLESKREKWRGAGAKYYRWAERAAVRWGQEVIADAEAIADHVRREYGRECVVIPYGASVIHPGADRLPELGLSSGGYHLVVARFEPENHVLDAVHAYRASREQRPLVVVGSAPYSQWYVESVRSAAHADPRVRFTGGIYDQALLDQLYANAKTYVHGHSVGGTNPSLLRAMGAGAPVLAYDVEFNREVTAGEALFWADADALIPLLDDIADGVSDDLLDGFSRLGRERVASVYQWEAVTDQYEALIGEARGLEEAMSSVAVVLVTKDAERWLPATLASIAGQTRPPDDIVAVDDGSVDRTLVLLDGAGIRTLAAATTSTDVTTRIAQNFVQGVRACPGADLVALGDHDDVWHPGRLAHQAGILEVWPGALMLASDGCVVDAHGEPTGATLRSAFPVPADWDAMAAPERMRTALRSSVATGGASMLRPSAFPELAVPDGWLHDRWWSLVATGRNGMLVDREPVIDYRVRAGQQVGLDAGAQGRRGAGRLVALLGQGPRALAKASDLRDRLRPLIDDPEVAAVVSRRNLL